MSALRHTLQLFAPRAPCCHCATVQISLRSDILWAPKFFWNCPVLLFSQYGKTFIIRTQSKVSGTVGTPSRSNSCSPVARYIFFFFPNKGFRTRSALAARQAGIRPAALGVESGAGRVGAARPVRRRRVRPAPSRLGLGGGGRRRKWHGRRRRAGVFPAGVFPFPARRGVRLAPGSSNGGRAVPASAVGVGSGQRLRLRHPAARAGAGRAACCRRRGAGTGPGVGDSISKQPTAALPSQLCADGARTGTGEARPR
jgi:hypothetical protein